MFVVLKSLSDKGVSAMAVPSQQNPPRRIVAQRDLGQMTHSSGPQIGSCRCARDYYTGAFAVPDDLPHMVTALLRSSEAADRCVL